MGIYTPCKAVPRRSFVLAKADQKLVYLLNLAWGSSDFTTARKRIPIETI